MSSSCFQRLSTLLILLALTLPTFQLAWQGTGDMNETVLAEVRSGINSGTLTYTSQPSKFDELAQNISTRLNKLWDPAWNVIVTQSIPSADTIVYGYAFNNHWMWICGNPLSGTTITTVDYIIWKDYNCRAWSTLGALYTAGSGFSSAQTTQISSYKFLKVNTDVWLQAHDFVEYLNTQSLLSSGAYSVLMSPYGGVAYNGYLCVVYTNFVVKKYIAKIGSDLFGSYFLFQTR